MNKPFQVWTQTSGIGNTVRNPHKVIDTRTNELVDEYTSKRAAQMDCNDRNIPLIDRVAAALDGTRFAASNPRPLGDGSVAIDWSWVDAERAALVEALRLRGFTALDQVHTVRVTR